MDDTVLVVEQDGSATDGGQKSYQSSKIQSIDSTDSLNEVDMICLFSESRLI